MRPDGTVGGFLFFPPSLVKVFTVCHTDCGSLTVTRALFYGDFLQRIFVFATLPLNALNICIIVEKTEIFSIFFLLLFWIETKQAA